MTHVRETIKLLSQILLENGTSEISAEIFRQAKFNQTDATPALWKLMFQLVYYCKFGLIDESAIKADAELSQEELCVYVKRQLQHLGYLLPDFACLSSCGDSGSRELLLALAWLICKEDIMEKFMNSCTSPIEVNTRKMYEDKTSSTILSYDEPTDPSSKVQKLLWLNGKLQLNLRRLYSVQIQDVNLRHKVHEATQGVSLMPYRNHLSSAEVNLLRYPDQLKKMLHLLEKDNERLHNLLLWKDQEHIFWTWMESVLELKISEGEILMSSPREVPTYIDLPADCNEEISKTRQQLVQTILNYEDIIDQLENLWTRKHEEISEQDLDNLLTSINIEIALQRSNLSLSTTETMLNYPTEPQFILQEPSKKPPIRPSKHLAPAFLKGQGDGQSVDINVAINDIEKRIEELENDLLIDQGICKTEMDKLANNISGVICIPPLALKRRT